MPKSVNKTTLMGHLGRDAEVRTTPTKRVVLVLATSEWQKQENSTEQFKELTTWHRIYCWGRSADKAENLKKGDFVYIDGKLENYEYQDETGQKKSMTYVKAWDVIPWVASAKKEAPVVKQQQSNPPEVPF